MHSIVAGELAENEARKDLQYSEAVAIYRTAEKIEARWAKTRQREHGGTTPGKHSRKLSGTDSGDARDKAAVATGKSGRSMEKAAALVEAAEAEPKKYGKLVADMDRTGRVDGPYSAT